MYGKFFGLGVGPGDPELVTIKAINRLKEVDVVIAPETAAGKGSVAYDIVRTYIEDEKKVKFQIFPMTYDTKILDESWDKNMKEILALLHEGKDVAFITLGDPMVYSTYGYVMQRITSQGIEVETIPGIPSFCAAASRLGIPLSEANETIAIIPAAYTCEKFDEILDVADNIVLMKPSRGFKNTVEKLEQHDLIKDTVLISKCGHVEEKISYDIASLKDEKIDYLSMLIAKKRGQK
ncbi:precorrin-2 C(20)-methyltransferase [Clostridiaceae bacterium 35-E11]